MFKLHCSFTSVALFPAERAGLLDRPLSLLLLLLLLLLYLNNIYSLSLFLL